MNIQFQKDLLIQIEQISRTSMQSRRLIGDENATDKVIVIALVSLLTISVLSVIAYVGLDEALG